MNLPAFERFREKGPNIRNQKLNMDAQDEWDK